VAGQLIECVPNFSEGRDPAIVDAIRSAIASVPGTRVLRAESDPDHNRSVITFAGPPDTIGDAAFAGIKAAVERINLRRHAGVHPRIGAADVVPFIPLEGASLAECAQIAHRTGQRVWNELHVPVYFYEAASSTPERAPLENIRRGGFEHPALPPDLGGPTLHPTAGAAVIGARKLLIAFNVDLKTNDLAAARAIARKIRASSGGLPALKAIGVALPTRNIVQVAMNLTDFERTPLDAVLAAVRREAAAHNIELAGVEYIGMIPRKAVQDAARRDPEWSHFNPALILENHLE